MSSDQVECADGTDIAALLAEGLRLSRAAAALNQHVSDHCPHLPADGEPHE